MRFDVLIADKELNSLEKFENYSNEKLKNITINFSIDSNKIINDIENLDLIILSTQVANYIDIINTSVQNYTYVILLTDSSIDIDESSKYIDYLNTPVNTDMLMIKIEEYTNILKQRIFNNQENEISNSIIKNITNPIFLTDGKKVLFANDYFYKLTNSTSLEMINNKYPEIGDIYTQHEECFNNKNNDWMDKCSKETINVCILTNDGEEKFYALQKISLSHNGTHIIILNDISHEFHHKKELYKLLYTDRLTNLDNRSMLITKLQSEKNLTLSSLCILDINSFKEINDFYGHKAGDSVLIELGNLIKDSIKEYTNLKLYKFPSDTYCITNIKNDREEFIKIIKKILEKSDKIVFNFDQFEIDVKLTAGLSFSHKNNKLITADIALQTAKKDHKDYMVFYDELDKLQEYENNMFWTKQLKSAFIRDNIEVYFQPLINNKTLKVDKYECLVRLIDDEGKVVAPFFFLDISKKSNQYTKLTKVVIEKSFKKFEHLDFEFSVNISYEDIEDPSFLDFIKNMLQKYNVSNKVVFEILEDENVKDYSHLILFVDQIKDLGCKVAIDDFGSGYSNFEHILKMNIDYLKIDASLIKNIATDENSYQITKTIVEFAKNLNLQTIAEYVENKEIFELTKELGVDYSQGYYFSPPIADPKLTDFNNGNKK
ncbi:GGDEF domain-containing phosphodiesterase [Poseidonibacter lekithochrous]|uniref:EAL domain-containing protein n=1 Tax=Poseidonibacter TaxID=2321187 RepID=UPI001C09387E|nr:MULTISPECIES: EAL domain-containing protein [Poseidonibacter]MBU3014894.1 GGDEF domain-containing phosphodiesterase [Poseidonibacter lekithochrous]MDO6828192.1 EAL domain-containing protein [Poseidonibacter sp. 1_MG-2023]